MSSAILGSATAIRCSFNVSINVRWFRSPSNRFFIVFRFEIACAQPADIELCHGGGSFNYLHGSALFVASLLGASVTIVETFYILPVCRQTTLIDAVR